MDIINWLNEGDVAVKYFVSRDLLGDDESVYKKYQQDMQNTGWVKQLVDLRDNETGMWGGGIYSPKWISTTYTMIDLKNFGVDPSLEWYQKSAKLLIQKLWVNYDPKREFPQDLCICGFLLHLCCYGQLKHEGIHEMVDLLLDYQMADGAWNCDLVHKPRHSSVHTTINVLDGFLEYKRNGYTYRIDEIKKAAAEAHEFLLQHRLYKSDKTGELINKAFTMLSYPYRWKYDVLRVMEYFAKYGVKYDERMDDALQLIKKKQRKDGTWPMQQKYAGRVHFDYEKTGSSSRINTMRVLRVLKEYGDKEFV